ncbi:rna-directed dna polymerase from mobile element jockey-hypothetical protein [Limosa lapponica baueri]|uniref:Rna-directed dna polymerase from mobile element jockey-like n=1 Tax=Limosa lapponica baueri TaxID=1758121 RepID=A0A2I0UUF3_LIMLA|nr:rna-directed dna polymerase from mobile element jockey-hypothetical protein [Limosa lapponica baueri]
MVGRGVQIERRQPYRTEWPNEAEGFKGSIVDLELLRKQVKYSGNIGKLSMLDCLEVFERKAKNTVSFQTENVYSFEKEFQMLDFAVVFHLTIILYIIGFILKELTTSRRDSGTEYTFSKFADDTKLSGAVDLLEGRDAIQRDLNRPEEQVCTNLMKFNKAKCKVLHLGRDKPQYQYGLGDEQI